MTYIIPGLIFVILIVALIQRVRCFDVFVEGAKEGAGTIVRLIPSLVGLIVAIGVFRASGAFDWLGNILQKPLSYIGMPEELLPLAVVRPVSGSGALAVLQDILTQHGGDSYIGRAACVMMGSSETILYTMAVYVQGTPVRRMPKVLPAALASSVSACMLALILCRVM